MGTNLTVRMGQRWVQTSLGGWSRDGYKPHWGDGAELGTNLIGGMGQNTSCRNREEYDVWGTHENMYNILST